MYLKQKLKDFMIKVKSKKIYYITFIICVVYIAYKLLGIIAGAVALTYFIHKISFIKKMLGKLQDKKTASIALVASIVIIFGLIFGFGQLVRSLISSGMASYTPQPVAVTSTFVEEKDWEPQINAIGEAQAVQSTQITSQSGGIVKTINFKSGQNVKQGDLLFSLDTSQLEASLDQAKANLKLTEITNQRYKKLVEQKATSKETADKAYADYLSAKAEVENIMSQIAFKEIRAPFDGKIGIRNISLGQYLNNGDNAATLTTIAPIYITFTIPQNKVDQINTGDEVNFYSDTYSGKTFKAKITAVNSFINSSNRSILVQATYENDNHEIVSGMFVTVHIALPTIKGSIIIPRNAINYNLYGESVFTITPLLDDDGKPKKATYSDTSQGGIKTVTTEQILYKVGQVNIDVVGTRDNFALVSGLNAGIQIITSGQNKVKKGGNVVLNNDVVINNNIYIQGA